jgi:next to BRCA1 gene 1 protein
LKVDASLKDSFYDSSQGLNLNIPLGVGSSEWPRIIDINVQPIEDDVFHQPQNPNAPPEPVNQMVDKEQRQELGNEFPTNEATFVGPAASAPAISVSPSSISYPIIDFSGTAPAAPSFSGAAPAAPSFSGTAPAAPSFSGTSPAAPSFSGTSPAGPSFSGAAPAIPQTSTLDALSSSLSTDNDLVEEALLKELEAMGFKQVDLNKEVLRMTDYNLEQSIDELCGVLDWDPLLEELHEMVNCSFDCFFI